MELSASGRLKVIRAMPFSSRYKMGSCCGIFTLPFKPGWNRRSSARRSGPKIAGVNRRGDQRKHERHETGDGQPTGQGGSIRAEDVARRLLGERAEVSQPAE